VQPRADAVVLTNILCDTYVEHRANERRVHLEKAVELLTKQKKIYENELNEEIIKSLREHEYALGGAAADPAAMIQQLDTVELSEAEKRSAAVAEKTATEEARITPSAAIEIEAGAMPQVKELRVELRRIRLDLAEAAGDRADALRRRREACEKMLAEETTKALKLTLDVHVQRADAAIAAAQREIQLIQEKRKALTESAATLRSLNSQYAVLQSHEQDMREKIRRSRDEIMRLTQSIIGAKFNSPVRLVALAS
jgi:hypothetical protein